MKTLFSTGAIAAFLGLAVVSTYAQTQTTTSSTTTYIETSKLVGKPVKSSQGEEIGTIKDVVIDRGTGCMAYTVLSTGGGGGRGAGGGKMVAVPWTVYSPSSDVNTYTVTVDRERIYNAPVFDYARIEEYSRPDYITNVYSYYGVSPAAGVGVSTGTTTTGTSTTTDTTTGATTTGANTTAGAASSPAAGAPAAGSPASTATDGRRAHPGAAAAAGAAAVRARETATPTPFGRAGTSPSKERTPSAKQKQEQATPSGRGKTETRSETERAPSEQGTTGEKASGSQRREKGKRGSTSPSEKPPGDE